MALIEDKVKSYEAAMQEIGNRIETWADLFEFLEGEFETMRRVGHEAVTANTALLLFAFMRALQRFPEEGDAKVITQHLFRILTIDSQKELGIDVRFQPLEVLQQKFAEEQAKHDLRTRGRSPLH